MLNLKKIGLVTTLTLALSLPALAQRESHAQGRSGSGNGSINRDVLDYETEVNDAALELRSLEEAFTEMGNNIRNISESNLPPMVNPSSDFWNTLTETDRVLLTEVDEALLMNVNNAIDLIEEIKKVILSEKSVIDTLARDVGKYEDRNMRKEFEKLLRTKRDALKIKLEKLLSKVPKALVSALVKVQQTYIYNNSGVGFRRLTYVSLTRENFLKCQTALCLDLLFKKYDGYIRTTAQTSSLKVRILGFNRKLESFYSDLAAFKGKTISKENKARAESLNKQLNAITLEHKNMQFTSTTRLHEQSVKTDNN